MTSTDVPSIALTGEESLGDDGVTLVPGCLAAHLPALAEIAGTLEAMAAERHHSDDDWILEAAGGGWVAWQQGDAPLAGTLRSVANAQRYAPRLLDVARDAGLADRVVGPRCGERVELFNAFLWAKPARIGSPKPWHQDMAFAPPGFSEHSSGIATLWVAIDPATTENGCLEFVLGSPRAGRFPHVGDEERGEGEHRHDRAVEPHIDPVHFAGYETRSAPLEPGSGVLFDGMTAHHSRVNTSSAPRRAFSFVFARRLA